MAGEVLKLDDGREIAIDGKGYLTDPSQWGPDVTEHMARADGVTLTADHLAVISIFRDYYRKFEIEPPMRALVKLVAENLGPDKGNSRHLYRLFPEGPTSQACRYAGLPRPLSCI